MKTTESTSQLWQMAHDSLCAEDWSLARSYLEDLSTRTDATDYLSPVSAYDVPESLLGIIGDRIEAVNSRVDRNKSLASQPSNC